MNRNFPAAGPVIQNPVAPVPAGTQVPTATLNPSAPATVAPATSTAAVPVGVPVAVPVPGTRFAAERQTHAQELISRFGRRPDELSDEEIENFLHGVAPTPRMPIPRAG